MNFINEQLFFEKNFILYLHHLILNKTYIKQGQKLSIRT